MALYIFEEYLMTGDGPNEYVCSLRQGCGHPEAFISSFPSSFRCRLSERPPGKARVSSSSGEYSLMEGNNMSCTWAMCSRRMMLRTFPVTRKAAFYMYTTLHVYLTNFFLPSPLCSQSPSIQTPRMTDAAASHYRLL
nr:hypothetical protein CFP56_63460 [Quercus suber]